ncbi:hypothetical protein MOX02_07840 [Methylobacterium oxalidis]|uniref:Uncharacterized protein n=1 Tax=Methylobacterium oxalidis TaxID=944322 RepID=A0A512IYG6_9HYPH|nr:hypothetical protein MOX02_07840 [Methylobacterium oxalidis]GLS66855.1 hypothetical protein GCM10007888_52380 [Methylobacterium oxalidis]
MRRLRRRVRAGAGTPGYSRAVSVRMGELSFMRCVLAAAILGPDPEGGPALRPYPGPGEGHTPLALPR